MATDQPRNVIPPSVLYYDAARVRTHPAGLQTTGVCLSAFAPFASRAVRAYHRRAAPDWQRSVVPHRSGAASSSFEVPCSASILLKTAGTNNPHGRRGRRHVHPSAQCTKKGPRCPPNLVKSDTASCNPSRCHWPLSSRISTSVLLPVIRRETESTKPEDNHERRSRHGPNPSTRGSSKEPKFKNQYNIRKLVLDLLLGTRVRLVDSHPAPVQKAHP